MPRILVQYPSSCCVSHVILHMSRCSIDAFIHSPFGTSPQASVLESFCNPIMKHACYLTGKDRSALNYLAASARILRKELREKERHALHETTIGDPTYGHNGRDLTQVISPFEEVQILNDRASTTELTKKPKCRHFPRPHLPEFRGIL